MIDQPEVGLLAIAVAAHERGDLALVQAKPEPGNINGIQISPTVQATRSNQDRVHSGRGVRYLDLFSGAAEVLVDSVQSEHGAIYWRKRNRIMIARTAWFEPADGFRWVAIPDLMALLHDDNLVHADTRAVLAGAPWLLPGGPSASAAPPWIGPTLGASAPADVAELRNWLEAERIAHRLTSTELALPDLVGWRRDEDAIRRTDGAGFEVVAVDVDASGREVDHWSQPMIRPVGTGVIGLAVAMFGSERRLLMQACPEPGLAELVELGPTVQIAGGELPRCPVEADLAQELMSSPPEAVLFDAELSDEGGRFLHGRQRHVVVQVMPRAAPEGYRWCSMPEVAGLLTCSHQVNMQARDALVCLLSSLPRHG